MAGNKVSYATGRFEDYDNIDYVPGRIYYLISDTGNKYIYLDGRKYTPDDAAYILLKNPITVTTAVGNYQQGDTIPANTPLSSILVSMFSADINPAVKASPAVTIGNTGGWTGAYEIGTRISLTYNASLSQGWYEIPNSSEPDQPGGVTASSWLISTNIGVTTSTEPSGTLISDYQLTDTSMGVTLTATATGTQGNMPKTFLGEDYDSIQFADGASYTKIITAEKCYRAEFYRWINSGVPDFSSLNGSDIRSLGTKVQRLPNSITTNQMQQMFFAAPAGKYSSISVVNANTGLPQNIVKYEFPISVSGANDYSPINYDVWYVRNAIPESGQSTFTITKTLAS